MKVLHGMSEVAGQGIYTVQGLLENGIDANMAVWSKNPTGYTADIDLKIKKNNKAVYPLYAAKMGLFAVKALFKYDTIHSHFGYSLLPYNLDLPVDKAFHKKIFAEFHGSDIRFAFHDIPYEFYHAEEIDFDTKSRIQRRLTKLIDSSDGIVLHDEELRAHLPDTDTPVYIVPLRLDIKKFTPAYPEQEKKKPVIVHAPSKRSTKGTEGILEAIAKVHGECELILVEGKTQQEAFEIYKTADIIIDQISVGTYGVFAIEAMAMGKPVITYVSEEMKKTFPDELPIVSANFDTLPYVLDELICDGGRRNQLGINGRKYAERYHDNVKITKYLAQVYEGSIEDNNLFHLL